MARLERHGVLCRPCDAHSSAVRQSAGERSQDTCFDLALQSMLSHYGKGTGPLLQLFLEELSCLCSLAAWLLRRHTRGRVLVVGNYLWFLKAISLLQVLAVWAVQQLHPVNTMVPPALEPQQPPFLP